MDPLLEMYLKQKLGDDFQQKAESDYKQKNDRINSASVASGFGDALAGRAPGSQDDYYKNLGAQAKLDTLGKVDKEKSDFMKDMTDSANIGKMTDDAKIRNEENAQGSDQAKSVAEQLRKLGVQVPDGLSLAEMRRNYGDAKSLNEIKMRSQTDFGNQVALKKMDYSQQAVKDQATLAREKEMAKYKQELEGMKKADPKSLSGTDKARYDNAMMVLKNLDAMGKALDDGNNTASIIGDNPYTMASRNATEAYGRMQSGGAINKDEEARFDKVLPGMLDTKEIQRQKILKQREEMLSRLKTLGFSPEQAGYTPQEFSYGKSEGDSKPTTVVQNGHTYTLNPKTGQYE